MNDGNDHNIFFDIITKLTDQSIYMAGYEVAENIYIYVFPVLLFLAVYWRTTHEFVAVQMRTGDYVKMAVDIFMWMMFGLIYIVFVHWMVLLFNAIYDWTGANGSLGKVFDQMARIVADLEAREQQLAAAEAARDKSFTEEIKSTLSSGAREGLWALYMLSFMLLTGLKTALHLGHAFLYSFAVWWGLVAIPLMITPYIKLIRYWAMLFFAVLLWPALEHIAGFMFSSAFANALDGAVDLRTANDAVVSQSMYYLSFGVLNIVLMAVVLFAPITAFALVGSGSVASMVSPFMAAGFGMGAFAAKAMKQIGGKSRAGTMKAARAGLAGSKWGALAAGTSFAHSMGKVASSLNQRFGKGAGGTPGGGGPGPRGGGGGGSTGGGGRHAGKGGGQGAPNLGQSTVSGEWSWGAAGQPAAAFAVDGGVGSPGATLTKSSFHQRNENHNVGDSVDTPSTATSNPVGWSTMSDAGTTNTGGPETVSKRAGKQTANTVDASPGSRVGRSQTSQRHGSTASAHKSSGLKNITNQIIEKGNSNAPKPPMTTASTDQDNATPATGQGHTAPANSSGTASARAAGGTSSAKQRKQSYFRNQAANAKRAAQAAEGKKYKNPKKPQSQDEARRAAFIGKALKRKRNLRGRSS